MKPSPRVVVLSAPSGGGKTTISRALLERYPESFGYSVSATTRRPRPGETDGEAYHFLSRDEFEHRRDAGEFLEWAEYAGALYGTLKIEVDRVLGLGLHVVMDIEVKGARQVWEEHPEARATSVFLLPPSAKVLIQRLRGRNTEAGEALARRVDTAVWEVRQASVYPHVVVNDVLEDAVKAVAEIVADGGRTPHPPDPALTGRIVKELVLEADRLRRTLKAKEP